MKKTLKRPFYRDANIVIIILVIHTHHYEIIINHYSYLSLRDNYLPLFTYRSLQDNYPPLLSLRDNYSPQYIHMHHYEIIIHHYSYPSLGDDYPPLLISITTTQLSTTIHMHRNDIIIHHDSLTLDV